MELFDKKVEGKPMFPLATETTFELLYSEAREHMFTYAPDIYGIIVL